MTSLVTDHKNKTSILKLPTAYGNTVMIGVKWNITAPQTDSLDPTGTHTNMYFYPF